MVCVLHSGGLELLGESGQWGIHLPVLVLLYFYERRKRELWSQQELAKSGENQACGILEAQPTALILCDFNGRLLVHNLAAEGYVKDYSCDNQLNPSVFADLLKKCCESEAMEKRIEGPSNGNLSVRVRCQRISWFSRNCALLIFTEDSKVLKAYSALTKVSAKVLNEVSTIERDVSRKFRDTNDSSTQLELCRLHTVLHEVNCSLAYQRAFTSHYETVQSIFHLRTELLDCIEFSSPTPETKALTIVLTFEACVPTDVVGDKVAVGCMFTYAYRRVTEASNRGAQVTVRVNIPSALQDSVKVSVNFDFLTNEPQSLMKDFSKLNSVESFASSEVGLGSFQAMLQAMKGECSAKEMTSEGPEKRVQIRYEFYVKPENKSEGRTLQPVVSHVRQELSKDKYKWDYLVDVKGQEPASLRRQCSKRLSTKRQ